MPNDPAFSESEEQSCREVTPSASPDSVTFLPHVPEVPNSLPPTSGTFPTTGGATMLPGPEPSSTPSVPGYEIQTELGRGGMGVVYKARQTKANRIVALKMILSHKHAGFADRVRFQLEAEAVARLVHPNIVQLYEVGECEGAPFFSLEFCEGGSLEQKMRSWSPTPVEAAKIVEDLARAMHFSHLRGVVHRDLKPANVLLDAGGEPKITDFGLAKRLDSGADLSRSGSIMGTPAYMAPEQAAGKVHDPGPAADVYSLGAMMYELLSGQPPFHGQTAFEVIDRVLHTDPAPPTRLRPTIPRDLETICLKCLRKDPGRRYASAEHLADDLARYCKGEPIEARPVGGAERVVKWIKRKPGISAAFATAAVVTMVAFVVVAWQLSETSEALAREQQAKRDRALARVDALRKAVPGAVPEILNNLAETPDEVLPRLRMLWKDNKPGHNKEERLRIGLALLAAEPDAVRDELVTWMLQAENPSEVLLVRDTLQSHAAVLLPQLWARVQEADAPPNERFRARVALAAFAPADPRWNVEAPATVDAMLSANPLHLGEWVRGLWPVRDVLFSPLCEVYRKAKSPERRAVAATVLTDHAAERPEILADLLLDADAQQFALLYSKFRSQADKLAPLEAELKKTPPATGKLAEREAASTRQANAAIILFRLGRSEALWPLLPQRADPTVRTHLIHRLATFGADPSLLIQRLKKEPAASARQALLLSLGEFTPTQLPRRERSSLVPVLRELYRTDPDPGVHSAVAWLLTRWEKGKELRDMDDELATARPTRPRDWYVNGQGQTLAIIRGPVEFDMGSPEGEPGRHVIESRHRRRIPRSFAIGTREVTAAEFRRFLHDRPEVRYVDEDQKKYGPEPDCPALSVTWFEAAQYCRWLSEQEDIDKDEMCYPEVAQIKEGMLMPRDYLSRKGYRLPTEAEWEFACRAGTTTPWHHGVSEDLLEKYGWSSRNSRTQETERAFPVGRLKPNGLGLFDVQGNSHEWCQERGFPYPAGLGEKVLDDREESEVTVIDKDVRIFRGGGFIELPFQLRSASRDSSRPTNRIGSIGFRIARTYPK